MALNSKDAAVLAVLAQEPQLSPADRKKLVESLSAPARKIANELNGASRPKGSAARAFRNWAAGLGSGNED